MILLVCPACGAELRIEPHQLFADRNRIGTEHVVSLVCYENGRPANARITKCNALKEKR
jgi:hypothetical protein